MNYWKTTLNGTNYSITIKGRFVEFTKDEGTAESFGGNNMPIERFFRSQKWQQHVENTYGEKILSEVLLAAESCKMVSKPVARRSGCKAQHYPSFHSRRYLMLGILRQPKLLLLD